MRHILPESIAAMTYKNEPDILYNYVYNEPYVNLCGIFYSYYGRPCRGLTLRYYSAKRKIFKKEYNIRSINVNKNNCIRNSISQRNQQFPRGV